MLPFAINLACARAGKQRKRKQGKAHLLPRITNCAWMTGWTGRRFRRAAGGFLVFILFPRFSAATTQINCIFNTTTITPRHQREWKGGTMCCHDHCRYAAIPCRCSAHLGGELHYRGGTAGLYDSRSFFSRIFNSTSIFSASSWRDFILWLHCTLTVYSVNGNKPTFWPLVSYELPHDVSVCIQ